MFSECPTVRDGHTLAKILGDYAIAAPMEMFLASKWDRHPTEIAQLKGARLVIAQETQKGRHWDEAKIKALTSSDPLSGYRNIRRVKQQATLDRRAPEVGFASSSLAICPLREETNMTPRHRAHPIRSFRSDRAEQARRGGF